MKEFKLSTHTHTICIMPMGGPAHSYIESASALPDYYDEGLYRCEAEILTQVLDCHQVAILCKILE